MGTLNFPGSEGELPQGCRWHVLELSPATARHDLVAPLDDVLSGAEKLKPHTRATLEDARITCLAAAGLLTTPAERLRCRQLGLEDRTDVELLHSLGVVLAQLGQELNAGPVKLVQQRLDALLDPRRVETP